MKSGLSASFLVLVAALLAGSCGRRVGGSCDKGDARCLDPQRQLVCEAGHYIEVPCRKGCSSTETYVLCDISANVAGDRCSKDEEGAATCIGPAERIVCRAGVFQRDLCRGPGGCRMEAGRAVCDVTRALAGDPCRDAGKKACAVDGHGLLACEGDQFRSALACRGPKGCEVNGSRLECDTTLASEGDTCDPRQEGHIACNLSSDKTLVCKNQKFVTDSVCARGTSCVVSGKETGCAKK